MMNSCKTLCFIFITILSWNQVVFAQAPDKINEVENNLSGVQGAEKDSAWNIITRMRYYGVKGVSIALIHNYRLEWTKGYGWADEEAKRPVTSETRFQAASISKSLNAVGVLKLVQNDKLDLYADINQYLTDWKFPYDAKTNDKKISTIELLSHTAGLNVHGFEGYQKSADLPSIIQILDGQPPANSPAIRSVMEPGLRSEYSGGGVTISQMIVVDITKMPYALYMQNEVLNPMGMLNSSYEQPTTIDSTMLATGYRANGYEVPGKYHIYPEQAAAGLWTTPTDLAKYIIETQLTYEGKSAKVLNQTLTRLRLTPYDKAHAALGVFISTADGVVYFQHSGGNEGFRCQYIGNLQSGDGLVIMTNSDNGKIIEEIMNSVSRVYHWKGLAVYHMGQTKTIMYIIDVLVILLLILVAFFYMNRRKRKIRTN